jgi:hypothetical protein
MTADQLKVFQNVQKILNLYPLPNVSGFGINGQNYNFSTTYSSLAPRREDILRVDYQLNGKNRLYGRWIHNAENDTSPFTPFPGPFGICCLRIIDPVHWGLHSAASRLELLGEPSQHDYSDIAK